MRSDSKNASYFDDDFEVTYEDELSFDYDTAQIDFETKELSSTRPVRQDSRHKAAWAKTSGSNYNDSYDDYADPYDEDSYDDYDEAYYNPPRHGTKRRHRHYPTRLAAPIQKGGSRILKSDPHASAKSDTFPYARHTDFHGIQFSSRKFSLRRY